MAAPLLPRKDLVYTWTRNCQTKKGEGSHLSFQSLFIIDFIWGL